MADKYCTPSANIFLFHYPNIRCNKSGICRGVLLKIHHMTRNRVFKTAINGYKQDHEEFLQMLIHICKPSTKSGCKSIKFHQPMHWYLTRIDMGCAAMEKSLEKMLRESQKNPSSLQTHASILRSIF